MAHEYKVIPAPRRGKRGRNTKGPVGRFAYAVESTLNEMAADGWEFVRAETLGAEEREGMMRRKIETFYGVLVFRRDVLADVDTAPKASIQPAKAPSPLKLETKSAVPAEDAEKASTELAPPASKADTKKVGDQADK